MNENQISQLVARARGEAIIEALTQLLQEQMSFEQVEAWLDRLKRERNET